jgi:hypothetical protein
MALTLVETTISAATIRMRFADQADAAKATEWIDYQVKLEDLKHASGTKIPSPMEHHFLGVLQAAAIRHVREAVSVEIQHLANLADRNA